jgi:hypothetical protein
LGIGSLILIPLEDFPAAFLAFFRGANFVVAFHLLAQVFDAPALAPMEESSIALPQGGQADTGIAGIGMPPSKRGMGEMKLS